MMNYDPNTARDMAYCHVIKVTLQQWDYTREYVTRVGGNVTGFDLFDTAIGNLLDEIIGDEHLTPDDSLCIELSKDGGTLAVDLNEDGYPEGTIKDMVVAVEIVDLEPCG